MSSSRTETSASAGLVDVTMPQMGVSVAEGTVVGWRVEIGDRIEADQTICEISTDKIDTEVPAPIGGVVAEILVPVDATVSVGTVLARIGSGSAAVAPGAGLEAPSAGPEAPGAGLEAPSAGLEAPSAGPEAPGAGPDGAAGPTSPQVAPATPSAAAGGAAGEPAAGEPAAGEPAAGEPAAGEPAAGEHAAGARAAGAHASAEGTQPPPHDAPESGSRRDGRNGSSASAAPAGANANRRRYSPVVQRIAGEHGIDLSLIEGTGRGGRVRKQDVLAYLEAGAAAQAPLHIESPYRPEPVAPAGPPVPATPPGSPTPTAPETPPPPVGVAPPPPAPVFAAEGGQLSRMRRQIGEHMKRSLDTAAHCTTWIEVDMSRVEAARARLRVTALAFVARAVIDALREHPALNAWLEGERYTQHTDVNLGIAVSLGEDGLIVPVIPRAHELSVEGLAARIKDLARRARARELTPDDVRDGTFTITNPGQYGSIMATPIINLPQVGILDFEAVVKRAVVITDGAGNDSIAIRPMTILGLSWDHRALDGALAAQFLATVKRHLEGVTIS